MDWMFSLWFLSCRRIMTREEEGGGGKGFWLTEESCDLAAWEVFTWRGFEKKMSPKKKHLLQSFHWLHYICLELWSSSFPTTTKRATSPNGRTTCNLLFSGPRLCSSHDNKAAKVSSFNSARAWFTAAATWAHLWRRCLRPRPGKRPTRCSPTPPWCWAAALRCGKRWAGGTPTHHLDKTEEIEWKKNSTDCSKSLRVPLCIQAKATETSQSASHTGIVDFIRIQNPLWFCYCSLHVIWFDH